MSASDTAVLRALDELPQFWTFFHARHPGIRIGAPDKPPIGYVPAALVDEKIAETIRAYVAEFRR